MNANASNIATLAPEPTDADLAATESLDCDNPDLVAYVETTIEGLTNDADKAAALFLAVRDSLRYDPYDISSDIVDYRASNVMNGSQKWCVSKAVLLTTMCRTAGLPSRLGFSDVKNHLQSNKLSDKMDSDLFVWHGYSVIWIDGQWRKASPAFNKEMCERFGTKVLEFDGHSDALLHSYDDAGNRHMEYVSDRGQFQDLPFDEIMATFADIYPKMINNDDQIEDVHDDLFHG